MIITSLNLKSFRSFAETDVFLNAPRVFVAGVNGAGKSTLREAIKWALTGRCQGLDGKGAGADKLVPSFAGSSHTVDVALKLNDMVGIERVWEPRGATFEVEGFMGTPTEQQKALYTELLKVPESYVDAALDSTVFLNLHHADAKALVLALLEVVVAVPVAETATPQGTQAITMRSYTLEQLDVAYDKAFKDRKAAKDKVKGAYVPAKPESPEPTLKGKTLADKAAHLEGIAGLLTELRRNVAVAQQQIGGTVAQRADLQARLAKAQSTVPVNAATLEYDEVERRIVDVEERLSIMEETSTDLPTIQRPAETVDIDARRQQAKTLRDFDPKHGCVLDARTPCPVAKVKFFTRAREIEDAVEKLTPAVPVQAVSAPTPANPLVNELRDLQHQKQAHEDYAGAIARQDALVRELTVELSALPDVSAGEQALAALEARVERGQAIERTAIAFYAACQAHEDAAQHRVVLEQDVTRLETLVDLLGPKGARVQALAAALGPFEGAINDVLAPFGWTVTFQVEPWQVVVNGRPVDTYSRSEQHRIGIALQVAIAEMSGLGFAIVDELDMLDSANREVMGKVLYSSGLDQVLMLGTREAGHPMPDVSQIPGMACIRLGKDPTGRTVVLEHSAQVAA